MQIKANFAAVKNSAWYEYAIRFAFGGAITVIAGLLAKKFGPAVGGLFLAFPAIFPASATLVEKHEIERKQKFGMQGQERGRDAAALDAAGAAMGSLALLLFGFLVWQFLPSHSSFLILSGAAAVWLAVSIAIWAIREYRHRLFRSRAHPALATRVE